MLSTLLCALVPLVGGGDDTQDLLVLKDGKKVECRVLYEDDATVVYRQRSKPIEVPRADVAEIQSIERSLAEYLQRFAQPGAREVGVLLDLGTFAETRHLDGEARATWLRILSLDPQNEQAWIKLGGVKRKEGYELKVKGKYLTFEELRQRTSDWDNALELPTAHFLVRSDAAIERTLDVAIDVERTCQVFYEVVGKPLKLYVFEEVPEINLYSDPKDYPVPPTQGMDAWFAPAENKLHVRVHEALDPGTVVGELVNALVWNAFRKSMDQKSGKLEPWVRDGLRQAFAWAVRPQQGNIQYEFGHPILAQFQLLARDEKPPSLQEVIGAGRGAFETGTNLARMRAAAYTLTHYLVRGEDGAHRDAFAEYLRDSYIGKGGKSNLLEALGMKQKDLEAAWLAHVKQIAGG